MMESAIIDRDSISNWLVERIAGELGLAQDSLPLDRAFFELGLNSLSTLVISGELGSYLGGESISPSLFWDYPTIDKLSDHLASAQADTGA